MSAAFPPSWYAASLPEPPALPSLQGNVQADVAVLGAGYTGLTAALELATRGQRVVVLDAEHEVERERALDDADEWLTELARGPARHRMLRLLLKLSEFGDENGCIWMPTRQEMGAMLDMTFETASRLVSALRREGVLHAVDARQARLDMDALMRVLKEDSASR